MLSLFSPLSSRFSFFFHFFFLLLLICISAADIDLAAFQVHNSLSFPFATHLLSARGFLLFSSQFFFFFCWISLRDICISPHRATPPALLIHVLSVHWKMKSPSFDRKTKELRKVLLVYIHIFQKIKCALLLSNSTIYSCLFGLCNIYGLYNTYRHPLLFIIYTCTSHPLPLFPSPCNSSPPFPFTSLATHAQGQNVLQID